MRDLPSIPDKGDEWRLPHLVVALTGFTTPRGGQATLVVSLTDDDRRTELGQTAVLPEQRFSASPAAAAKHFGFALPERALALDAIIMVKLAAARAPAR